MQCSKKEIQNKKKIADYYSVLLLSGGCSFYFRDIISMWLFIFRICIRFIVLRFAFCFFLLLLLYKKVNPVVEFVREIKTNLSRRTNFGNDRVVGRKTGHAKTNEFVHRSMIDNDQ